MSSSHPPLPRDDIDKDALGEMFRQVARMQQIVEEMSRTLDRRLGKASSHESVPVPADSIDPLIKEPVAFISDFLDETIPESESLDFVSDSTDVSEVSMEPTPSLGVMQVFVEIVKLTSDINEEPKERNQFEGHTDGMTMIAPSKPLTELQITSLSLTTKLIPMIKNKKLPSSLDQLPSRDVSISRRLVCLAQPPPKPPDPSFFTMTSRLSQPSASSFSHLLTGMPPSNHQMLPPPKPPDGSLQMVTVELQVPPELHCCVVSTIRIRKKTKKKKKKKMRVAVVGAGISGLVSAYVLAKAGVNVVLYEKEDYLGGHSKTVNVDGLDFDLGFMVFNRVTYPNMMEFFESLGVDMEISDMSFSVSLDKGRGCEWGSRNGLSGLFAQKRNILNPYFLQMIREIVKFKDDVISYLDMLENNPHIDRNESLGQFVKSRGYSELFQKAYLIPICGSIWSCSSEGVMSFSAFSVLSFCCNHYLLQLFGRPQWLTVRWRSQSYVKKVKEQLESKGCQIRANSEVHLVTTSEKGCVVCSKDGSQEMYDGCILAAHAPDALRLLGDEATYDERRILGAFQYAYSDIFLHRDKNLMPQNPAAWSAWNFLGSNNNRVCVTYWLNILQNIEEAGHPVFVTLNPDQIPENTLLKWSTGHPIPSVSAFKASVELDNIQGKRRIWFSGAYQGYGFHEDGLKAGMIAAHGILGKSCALQINPKHMVPSWKELGARLFVTRFLSCFITTGCLTLLEEGGTMFTFEGAGKKCFLKCALRVHNPQFYWKLMTQADLGLADAYINGDFSFIDKDEGLLNFFLILIANRDLNASNSKLKNRGWWTPVFFTAGLASAKFFMEHVSRQNTLTQARRNISRHYDLSNELFALFLDETMTYSCAVFKNKDEDLKDAQMRKISLLIEKARIAKKHEILEIGCGWGSLAIEVVKQTGCKYTGITLSKEQLKLAEQRVKEAGLQDNIKFLLCDYRQLPKTYKCDRIISCEMLEAVGHEFMEEFFGCCESVLADDGLLVLQFISIPDERYDEYRRSSDFIKEYIFPGGCLPSLSRVTSAMAAKSRLCVEHVENIGIHYYQTLRCWRKNFLERKSEILDLGFNEKFIRTWEYYFDYSGAGFKSRTLGNYQVVFSRPGNATAFSDPYKSCP